MALPSRSEVAEDLAALARGECPPGCLVYPIPDEPDGAVAQQQVDPAGVVAPRRRQPLVVAAIAAVPLALLVGGVVVVVERVAVVPVDPLLAAPRVPRPVAAVAVGGRGVVPA